MSDIRAGSFVRVRGWGSGIAFVVLGPVKVWEPYRYMATDPETGEEFEAEDDEGEWTVGDGSRCRVRMVGDDRVFEEETDDLTPLDREAFCGACGQIGCAHDGYERDE